jgi:anaerobic magnesium-protoporphyrin IX monomethyl ester cyclase
MPNTRFHQIVQERIGAQANWRDSGDLAMMYQGAFSTEFYRALADALHSEVRGGSVEEAWEKVEQLRCACC